MRLSVLVVALSMVVGCGETDALPLGGPFGVTPAVDGSVEGTFDSGTGTGATTPPDAGVAPPPGTGTGTTTTPPGTGVGTSTPPGAGVGTTTPPGSGIGSSSGSGSGTGTGSAPTWTYLYNTYLSDATSTPGDCDGSCHHHSECSSPSACYSWIGTGLFSLGTGGDLFSWDSLGWMPTNGPSSLPQANTDFDAWIAAGKLDN